MYRKIIKPLGDFLLALTGFLVIFPLLLLITVLLTISNGGKPFFYQKRPGKGGKIFTLVKFKTMNDARDARGELLPDVARITPIGKFIRNASLDELMQLVNVIKGDMSLIGPRPLLTSYLPLYSKQQARRHEVKPGITGWAQVHGRNAISWEDKFAYDVWYVDHVSFKTDLRILLKTVEKVFKREGISASESHTMPMFQGTAEPQKNQEERA